MERIHGNAENNHLIENSNGLDLSSRRKKTFDYLPLFYVLHLKINIGLEPCSRKTLGTNYQTI